MLTDIIAYALSNFTLVAFVAGVGVGFLNWSTARKPGGRGLGEQLFRWIILSMGVVGIYAFILHAFFPELAAKTIGWQNSPFQFEVAVANLGFGVIAIWAFTANFGFRLAAVAGNTCWLWGDAAGHIYQMATTHDFSAGNAGSWFWLDVLYPLTLIILLVGIKRKSPHE